MLKFIRRNASASWVKLIFGAIVVVFIFWGIGGGLAGGGKVEVVARVDDSAVEPADFQRTYNSLLRLYRDLYKDRFRPEMAKMMDLKGKALDQAIHRVLIREEAKRIQLQVSDTEVRDSIAAMPVFQDSGVFQRDLYERVLRANGMTPGEFEAGQRDDLLTNKMQELIGAGVGVSEGEARELFHFENDKVSLRFLKFEGANYFREVEAADGDVREYYDKHQDTLRQPDRLRIDFVTFPPQKFADQAQIGDAEVKQYYDGHVAEYERPERVHPLHILVKIGPDATEEAKAAARKKAEDLLAKARAGEDFASLAQQNSEDSATSAQGGDLGFFGPDRTDKPYSEPGFQAAVFALSPGQVGDIIETSAGLHVVKLQAKEAARTPPLEEVREQIVAAVRPIKARVLAQARADAAREKLTAGGSLADVVAELGLSVQSPAPFSAQEPIADVAGGALRNAAFAAEVGKAGPVVEDPAGYYVFVVKEKIAAHVPPLEEIRAKVEESVRTEKAAALAKTKAEAARTELTKSDIDSVAKSYGLTAEETAEFPRAGSYIQKIGNAPELKRAAFTLTKENPVAPEVYDVSGDSVVAVLQDRQPADEEKFKTDKDSLIKSTEDRRRNQVMQQFLDYLKARATIEVNQEYLAAVPENGQPLENRPRRGR